MVKPFGWTRLGPSCWACEVACGGLNRRANGWAERVAETMPGFCDEASITTFKFWGIAPHRDEFSFVQGIHHCPLKRKLRPRRES